MWHWALFAACVVTFSLLLLYAPVDGRALLTWTAHPRCCDINVLVGLLFRLSCLMDEEHLSGTHWLTLSITLLNLSLEYYRLSERCSWSLRVGIDTGDSSVKQILWALPAFASCRSQPTCFLFWLAITILTMHFCCCGQLHDSIHVLSAFLCACS